MAQQDLARINLKSISPNPHGGPLTVCVAPQREREVKNMYSIKKYTQDSQFCKNISYMH